MKYVILTVITLFLFGCNFNQKKQSESSNTESKGSSVSKTKEVEKDTLKINYLVAINFLNSYVERNNGTIEFTKNSPLVTDNFKNNLERIMKKAWEDFPETGLEFDPIFDGQDYPVDGFEILDINKETGYVVVKGIKWDSFKVTLKLINENGKTLIDGSGIINIPEEERSER